MSQIVGRVSVKQVGGGDGQGMTAITNGPIACFYDTVYRWARDDHIYDGFYDSWMPCK